MARVKRLLLISTVAAGAMVWVALPARADAIEDFYKGRTITVITSTGEGGSFTAVARAVARHIPRYIPGNPSMIVKNMPGAGNLLATNFMYNQAPQDGTHIATVVPGVVQRQIVDPRGVYYDARRFNWLGSTGNSNLVSFVWHAAGVKTLEDVIEREITAGATGVGSNTFYYPNIMNKVLGTKFKIVMGYKTTSAIDLALVRGEVDSHTGGSLSTVLSAHPDWVTEEKVRFLMQIGRKRAQGLEDVPLFSELGKTDKERQILQAISSHETMGRPYLAPPSVPAERIAALRAAFTATMNDDQFRAEATKSKFELDPITGDELAKMVMQTVNAPSDIVAEIQVLLKASENADKPGSQDQ